MSTQSNAVVGNILNFEDRDKVFLVLAWVLSTEAPLKTYCCKPTIWTTLKIWFKYQSTPRCTVHTVIFATRKKNKHIEVESI